MVTNECSQPASKSSWDSQDFGDINMELKITHFHKSSWPQCVKINGLPPIWHQAIIWTNADSLLIGPLWTSFNEILIRIPQFSFKKVHLQNGSIWSQCNLKKNITLDTFIHFSYRTHDMILGDKEHVTWLWTLGYMSCKTNIVHYWYLAVTFLQITHERHP